MKRILFVEDNDDVREHTAELLQRCMDVIDPDMRLLQASNGFQAASIFKRYEDEIEAVITDWQMPSMDGVELLRIIRKSCPEVSTLVMSGDPFVENEVIGSGVADEFMFKGAISVETITQALKRLLKL